MTILEMLFGAFPAVSFNPDFTTNRDPFYPLISNEGIKGERLERECSLELRSPCLPHSLRGTSSPVSQKRLAKCCSFRTLVTRVRLSAVTTSGSMLLLLVSWCDYRVDVLGLYGECHAHPIESSIGLPFLERIYSF